MIGLTAVLQLAVVCAPLVAPGTVAAIAHAESGFNPLAIGDNNTGRSYSPASVPEAVSLGEDLMAQGHSIDVGLMQINSANLPGLHLSIAEAFDACRSVQAGARILADAYAGGTTPAANQAALRVALSRYNTGNAELGFSNGYVRRVEASALQLVPALQVAPSETPPQNVGPRPLPTATPEAADGEWHARSASGERDGEWHANTPSASPTEPTSATSGPASIVVLQRLQGSKS